MDKPKYYLTTPIYYANSRPHVGSAYTTIVCDVIARYKRMCGYEVAYLTGTDEHGVNIERAAEKLGVTPQELVDKNQQIFRDLWKLLGISDQPYFHFVRTTSPEHARAVQTLVRRTLERDKDLPIEDRSIYKDKYEGRYCIYDNLYVSDTPEPANCQICGRPAELISEENYFFRLRKYEKRLLDLYENNPQWVQPDFKRNEVASFVKGGLKDISISRKTIKWGIPWPDDPEHVFYVWYDALTSYMSGIGYGEGPDGEANPQFRKFWLADDSFILHMIGKEIIRFHAVYWPAFLMAAGLPLPDQIFAHGWLLFEQEKMSKSKGNVAYPEPIVKAFDELTSSKVGSDALRYYLLRETVLGADGNFSRDALITCYNAYLANGLGNLTSRILKIIEKDYGGRVPSTNPDHYMAASNDWRMVAGRIKRVRDFYGTFEFTFAISEIWGAISELDRLLSISAPSKNRPEPEHMAWIIYDCAESLRCLAVLSHPIIPDGTQRIWEQLGQTEKLADFPIEQLEWGGLKSGTPIGKLESVFPRVWDKDRSQLVERIETMENEIRNPGSTTTAASTASDAAAPTPTPSASASSPAAPAGTAPAPAAAGAAAGAAATLANAKITIEDFAKVELRVGVVKTAERVQGADKLLKLTVDIGDEVRQVLAGIALAYTPEELVGRRVVIVVNLAPRKMRGVESNGMLLAASAGADGKPVLCTFAEDIPAGAKVK